MKKVLFNLQLAGLTLLSSSAFAATVEELLAAGTAKEVGHAIAKEADDRDFGFGDFEVDVVMNLKNARGQSSKREMRNKTFEMADMSVGDKTMMYKANQTNTQRTLARRTSMFSPTHGAEPLVALPIVIDWA